MDGTVVNMMDMMFDQALEADINAEMNAAKLCGHVEEVEVPVDEAFQSYCMEHGLKLPLTMAPSALELNNRDDDEPMEQEPNE